MYRGEIMEIGEIRNFGKKRSRKLNPIGLDSGSFARRLLAVCFIAGSVFGVLVGSFSPIEGIPGVVDSYIFREASSVSFVSAWWGMAWYHLLAAFLGASAFGLVLLPALAALRGYLISIAAASIMLSVPEHGDLTVILHLAIPALFSIPCFFILLEDAFAFSGRLYSLLTGLRKPVTGTSFVRHFAACSVVIMLPAAFQTHLLPKLMQLLIQ